MKVLIIEDEQSSSKKLARLLEQIDTSIEIVGILRSIEETINWFLKNPAPEVIFMDIQLEDGTCFEIFENIDLKTPVIFTTAFNSYALKAFKVNSVDYLLKPIDIKELKNAIDKYKTVYNYKTDFTRIGSLINQPKKERFLIKIGDHYKSIPTSAIKCFYIKERCNFINTDNGKNYAVDYSLDSIEQMIDSKLFFRINRNYIINFSAINDVVAYSSNRLKIKLTNWSENEEILVSRERVADFKRWMDR